MNQADGGGAGSGSSDGAADAGGAGAAAAQAKADGGAGSQAAGTTDQNQAGADADQREIVWNGQKIRKPMAEIINLAQQAYNVTQIEQALAAEKKQLAQSRKDYQVRLLQMDRIEAELRAGKPGKGAEGGEGGEGQPDPDEPLKKLEGKFATLEQKQALLDWKEYYGPVKLKFPDVSEKMLVQEFEAKIQAGEVDDSVEGLMQTAEAMANGFESMVDTRLDKLLADPNNAKVKAHDTKVIADYVAGKTKLADAGGDKGAGGSGSKTKESRSIDEVADEIMSR